VLCAAHIHLAILRRTRDVDDLPLCAPVEQTGVEVRRQYRDLLHLEYDEPREACCSSMPRQEAAMDAAERIDWSSTSIRRTR